MAALERVWRIMRSSMFFGGAGFVLVDAFCYATGLPVPQGAMDCLVKAAILAAVGTALYWAERPRPPKPPRKVQGTPVHP